MKAKNYLFGAMLTTLFLVFPTVRSLAYDFSATNDNGKTIYYKITSSDDQTVAITYGGNNNRSALYDGDVIIPSTVQDDNGTTYSVTSIGDDAFYYCTSLTSIVIPSSITSIGEKAFYKCTSLTSIEIPSGVIRIENYTFYGCTSLASVTIPNSVTWIGWEVFYNCTSLTSIKIPSSVTSITGIAFYRCTSLTSIEVETDNKKFCSKDGVLFSKDMKELIVYPAGLTGTSYEIPNTVTSIGQYAFAYCSSLSSVVIPNGVTSIGEEAFFCSSLTSIEISSSVTRIDNYAFDECTSLASITSLNPEPPVCGNDGVFYKVDKTTCILYVPKGSVDAYASASQWKAFYNIVEIGSEVNGISGVATDGQADVSGYFTIDGKEVSAPQKGVSIVKYSDGTTKKVLAK